MAVPTANQLRTRFPVFEPTTWSTDQIEMYIDEAACEVSECIFGAHHMKAIILLACHFMARDAKALADLAAGATGAGALQNVGAANAIQSATVGDTSISYATSTPASGQDSEGTGDLDSTSFGQEFIRIRAKVSHGGMAVTRRRSSRACAGTTCGL